MNVQHLRAFLWLRWRLRINQLKRRGTANAVILALLAVAAVSSAAVLFVIFLAVGLFQLKDAKPMGLLYVMDGIVLAFLFFWTTGLLAELQRSEALSLEKFLHLPVSLTSAFLINYFSSLPSLSLLWFVSAMLGLNLGLLLSRGGAMLWLLPMLAAFLLMVTALTYQFQGWLAAMMTNPRRRNTVILAATMTFILLAQVPNLVNTVRPWRSQPKTSEVPPALIQELKEHQRDPRWRREQTPEERQKRAAEMQKKEEEFARKQAAIDLKEQMEQQQQNEQAMRLMNLFLPPGWLPAGVEAAAESNPWPILLALVGPSLIGTASLWRAYRTTMRLYTGQFTSGPSVGVSAPKARKERPLLALRAGKEAGNRAPSLLEKKLPWLSEQATAITLAAFRSLLRAPEAKLLLLSPILMLLVFGSLFLAQGRADMPEGFRPLMGFGAMVMVLFSMAGILGNQFGFDRDGFRVFVLSPVRRRDILLGKNLAFAPIALTLGAAAAVFVQAVYPMRLDLFLALAPKFVSMYLLYCLAANSLSILVPMRIAPSSFQPAKPSALAILLQFVFMFFCPAVMTLTLLPFLIEWGVEYMGWLSGLPLDLLLSLLECAAIVCIYALLLTLQGHWLQAREQRILQIVTTRAN